MSNKAVSRRRALITGAAGGMGQACARNFGETMDLVLTDIAADRLAAFTDSLTQAGYKVAASIPGDLDDPAIRAGLVDAAADGGGLGALVHTAAISQIMASWEPILRINLIGTVQLIDAIEPILQEKSVAVLIASMAGHMAPESAEADALLDDPLCPDLMERIGPIIEQLAQGDSRGSSPVGYGLAKRAVMRLCERRVDDWARKGARILSISPGMIWTPMGQVEASGNPNAAAVVEATPVGRWGTAMDIAAAARFLASDAASFITGTDLRVDGGVTPFLKARQTVAPDQSPA